MKSIYSLLAAALLLGLSNLPASAAVQVSVDFFHENLAAHGDWREVGDYGYCWQPRDVGRDWQPYGDGRWLYTDAGWTWDSEEPYSWAVYHYGRWARVDRVGWVWVPGTEWGPAWVSWRRGPRHVGWAPLPPEARFARTTGITARVDADYDIGPTNYRFVAVRDFGAPRLRTVFVEPRENITIIRQTTNITRITYVNNVVYNEGPQYDVISRESAQPIRRLRLERREDIGGDVRVEQLRSQVDGESYRVAAPSFDSQPAKAPRKVAARVEKVEVDRGWKNAGPPAEVEKLRTQIKSEPAPAEQTADAPVPAAVPGEKPGKAKMPEAGETAKPAAAVTTEGVPPASEKPTTPPEKPVIPSTPAASEKPAKTQKSAKPEKPVPPATPAPLEKPVTSEKAVKPDKPIKGAKPENPEGDTVPPAPTAVENAAPPSPSKKGRAKGTEVPPTARDTQPAGKAERARDLPAPAEAVAPPSRPKKGERKDAEAARIVTDTPSQPPVREREKNRAETPRVAPPAEAEPPRQKNREKREAAPQPEPIAPREVERKVPSAPPEPRPQEKKTDQRPPPPAAAQPQPQPTQAQPPQPAKEKAKGKDEKKED